MCPDKPKRTRFWFQRTPRRCGQCGAVWVTRRTATGWEWVLLDRP